MIDWQAFLLVALVSIGSAAAIVALYATGIRLLATEPRRSGVAVGAYACFALAAAGALYGIYLIVPAFHAG